MKSERFYRTLQLTIPAEEDSRTFKGVALSSEEPVEMLDKQGKRYFEVLKHDPDSMSLVRSTDGTSLKLLWEHDLDTVIGRAENIKLDPVDRKLRADIRFGYSAKAEEVYRDVKAGILTEVSIGYLVNGKNTTIEDRGGSAPITHVNKWGVFEASVVNWAADYKGTGFNRSVDPNGLQDEDEDTKDDPTEDTGAVEPTETPAEESADNAIEAEEALRSSNIQPELSVSTENISVTVTENINNTTDISFTEGTNQRSSDLSTTFLEGNMETNEVKVTQPIAPANFRARDLKDYSIAKHLRSLLNSETLTGLEGEVAQEIKSRNTIPTQVFANYLVEAKQRAFALTGGATSGGTFNVPEFAGYLDLLLPQTLFGKLGCPTMNLAQPITLPGAVPVAPVTGTELTISSTPGTPVTRSVNFSPLAMVAQLPITRIALDSGTPGVEQYLMNLLMKQHVSAFENAAFARILTQINQTFDYTTSTSDHNVNTDSGMGLLNEMLVVTGVLDELETSAYVTNHAMFNKLGTVKRSANLTVPVAVNGQIWDRKAVASARVAGIAGTYNSSPVTFNPVIYGAWEYCQLANFGAGVRFLVDELTQAGTMDVIITAQSQYDAEITQPSAFVSCVNAL